MKVNGYRADDLARVGLITRERWVMPLWMSMIGVCFRALWRALVWLIRRGAITGPAVVLKDDLLSRNVAKHVHPGAVRSDVSTRSHPPKRECSSQRPGPIASTGSTRWPSVPAGELLGLRWADVDLERRNLHIRRNLQRVRKPESSSAHPRRATPSDAFRSLSGSSRS